MNMKGYIILLIVFALIFAGVLVLIFFQDTITQLLAGESKDQDKVERLDAPSQKDILDSLIDEDRQDLTAEEEEEQVNLLDSMIDQSNTNTQSMEDIASTSSAGDNAEATRAPSVDTSQDADTSASEEEQLRLLQEMSQ